jgi:hypothetical protein
MRTVPGEDFPLLLGPRSVTPEATLVQDADGLLLGSAQRRTSEASGHLLMEFALRSSRITRRAGSRLKRHPDALERYPDVECSVEHKWESEQHLAMKRALQQINALLAGARRWSTRIRKGFGQGIGRAGQ